MMKYENLKEDQISFSTFKEADDEDIFYWASKTPQERLIEAERLRKIIWTHRLGKYPTTISKEGGIMIKTQTDEDDF